MSWKEKLEDIKEKYKAQQQAKTELSAKKAEERLAYEKQLYENKERIRKAKEEIQRMRGPTMLQKTLDVAKRTVTKIDRRRSDSARAQSQPLWSKKARRKKKKVFGGVRKRKVTIVPTMRSPKSTHPMPEHDQWKMNWKV